MEKRTMKNKDKQNIKMLMDRNYMIKVLKETCKLEIIEKHRKAQ